MLDIGIVNAWGSNRGDEAMISSLLLHLQERYPGVRLTVYSNQRLDLTRFGVASTPWIMLAGGLMGLLNHRGLRRFYPPLTRRRWRKFLANPAAFEGLLNHDLVISSPGGPYLGDMYRESEHVMLLPLGICVHKKIPFCVLATSSGPFDRLDFIRRGILDHASLWTLREQISKGYVESLHPSFPVYAGSDLVYAHRDRPESEFVPPQMRAAFDKARNFLAKPTIAITLNLTGYVTPQGGKTFDMAEYAPKMGGMIRHAVRTTRCRALLFPHFYGMPREMQVLQEVLRCAAVEDHVMILDPALNAEAQMHLYSLAEFALSHRYHPTIFAFRKHVPALCIRHQYKVEGMLKLFDNPGPVVRTPDSLMDWKSAFDQAWSDRSAIKTQISQRLPQVRRLAEGHFEHLDALIQRIARST